MIKRKRQRRSISVAEMKADKALELAREAIKASMDNAEAIAFLYYELLAKEDPMDNCQRMVKLYARLVRNGKKKIEDLPRELQQPVKKEVSKGKANPKPC
jgi:hypothetical protein